MLAIPQNTEFTDHTGARATIAHRATRLAPNAWQRRACGIGTKGFRVYDWALLDSEDPDHPYLIRRSLDNGELTFYHCYNPRHEGFAELVRVAGARWPIEECFESSQGGVGLDDYQVRLYHAWHRHITLAMLAHAFLALCARHHKNTKKRPNTHSQKTYKPTINNNGPVRALTKSPENPPNPPPQDPAHPRRGQTPVQRR